MIWAMIAAAVNRDPQGEPVFIRCARCGSISDVPMRISSVTTFRPSRVDLPLLRPRGSA